jgi:hypothetical protein
MADPSDSRRSDGQAKKKRKSWLKITVKTKQQRINIDTLLLCVDGNFKTFCFTFRIQTQRYVLD